MSSAVEVVRRILLFVVPHGRGEGVLVLRIDHDVEPVHRGAEDDVPTPRAVSHCLNNHSTHWRPEDLAQCEPDHPGVLTGVLVVAALE